MKNEIIVFEENNLELEVNIQDENVWLTQKQMSELFEKSVSTINEHIKNIYKENELIECDSMRKFGNSEFATKPTNYYNLDVIISLGYRVKSPVGTKFRQWANKVLKEYMLKGYSINQKRLEYLEKTIKIIDIANRIDDRLLGNDAKEILKVIGNYTKALELLDSYDNQKFNKIKGQASNKKITYEECIKIIRELKFHEKSSLFALEREMGLKSIIANIYQTFDSKDVYPTIEEKAANFLYMVVKDHVFIDGNKRIAATLFIYFLQFYGLLIVDNKFIIDNNTLVAMTLLIVESNPKEKDIIIDLVMNFLDTSIYNEEQIVN